MNPTINLGGHWAEHVETGVVQTIDGSNVVHSSVKDVRIAAESYRCSSRHLADLLLLEHEVLPQTFSARA